MNDSTRRSRWACPVLLAAFSVPLPAAGSGALDLLSSPAILRSRSAQEPAAAPQNPERAGAAKRKWFRGRSWTRYWRRWTAEDTDQDVLETLSLDLGDAEEDPVTVHLMGRLAADLDGYDPTFRGISDSYGRRTDALLYDGYADLHRVPGLSMVRLGRQTIQETPEVAFFDGLRVETEEITDAGLQFGTYVGASTHLYESSPAGDLTAGAYAQGRPWKGGRLRIDYLRLEDRALFLGHDDDIWGAGLWQRICDQLSFDAQYSRIENRDRDVRGRLVATEARWDLLLQASYYRLLTAQGNFAVEADPFFNSVHVLYPYTQWGILLSKGLSEKFDLQGGIDLRRVEDVADVGTYNRDYDRYWFSLSADEIGVRGLSANVTADFWNSGGQLVRTWGGSVERTFDRLTASLGTYWSLYKFDLYSDQERDHVRTWFGKLRYRTGSDVTVDLDYELEDDAFDRTHSVRMGVAWLF
ncbi:MAG: hypothetical protein Fur0037_02030 [Planctomycetota bacterium]